MTVASKAGPARAPLAFLLAQVGAHAALRYADRLSVLQLTPPHAGILWALSRLPGQSQQALVELLSVHPSRLVTLLDELESRKLLQRRVTKRDRRTNALQLTARGEEMLGALRRVSREHREQLCASLSEGEQELLAALLQRIADQQGLRPGVHPGYARLGSKSRGRGVASASRAVTPR
jgi:DNA-binding MarR family transcriptional regulator